MDEVTSAVIAAQQGDKTAFGQIVQRFQDMAYASAYAMLGETGAAQDAAQEAFIDAYVSLPKLREPAAFPGWFRRIIHKHSDRQIRGKQVTFVPLDDALELRSPYPGPDVLLEQAQMEAEVHQAILRLPLEQSQVMALFYVEGYSQQEIASFLELPITTIKKRLFDARKRLKERMMGMIQSELQAAKPSQTDHFARKVAFFVAVKANDLRQVEALLNQDPDLVHAQTEYGVASEGYYWPTGVTVLNWAAGTGNAALVKLLLANGADVNAQPKPEALTPLQEAIYLGQTDMVKLLLTRGANVNVTTVHQQTALHHAVHKKSVLAAELLLKAGAKVADQDAFGRTPMDWALIYQCQPLVDLLTTYGAAAPAPTVVATTSSPRTHGSARLTPVGDALLGRTLNGLGQPLDGGPALGNITTAPVYRFGSQTPIFATGIKIIDLFAPFKAGGHHGLFTPLAGVGKMVVLSQLIYSMAALHDGYTVCIGLDEGDYSGVSLMHAWRQFGGDSALVAGRVVNIFGQIGDPASKRLQVAETGLTLADYFRSQGRNVLLLVDSTLALTEGVLPYLRANTAWTPTAAVTTVYYGPYTVGSEPTPLADLDAAFSFSLDRATQRLYPAVDPLRAYSKLLRPELVGEGHVKTVADLQALLRRYEDLRPLYEQGGLDKLGRIGDPKAAQDVLRARRIDRFLTQPLFGAESFTGIPGTHVNGTDAVCGCRALLDGVYDALPEEAFAYIGRIEQAVAKAHTA